MKALPRPDSPPLTVGGFVEGRARVATVEKARLVWVDVSRGLFLYWMIVAHALTLTALESHPLAWMRPAGWATHCFVTLSGFTIAAVYRRGSRPGAGADVRLRRRALEIGLVAVVSNLFYRVVEGLVSGDLDVAFLIGNLLFLETWSVSRILIPTALLLALGPALLRQAERTPAWVLLLSTTVAGTALAAAVSMAGRSWQDWLPVAILLGGTKGPGIPIVHFVLLGVWGFALRLVLRERADFDTWLLLAAVSGLLVPLLEGGAAFPGAAFPLHVARFTLCLAVVNAAMALPALGTLRGLLALLGRSALLVFVLHRAVIQAVGIALRPEWPAAPVAIVMILAALGVSAALAWWREQDPRVDRSLRRIAL